MKKILFFALLMVCVSVLKSQPKYSFAGGVKLIKPDDRTVTLWYVDESPSMDNLYVSGTQDGNMSYLINFRIQEKGLDKKFKIFGEGQGYFGVINGLALNIGYLYCSNSESNFRVQPELAGLFGYSTTGMGEIENNDVYIQVNDTKFQDYTNVNVALRNVYVGIKPTLSFVAKISTNQEIGLGVSYQLSYKFGKVVFTGTGEDGNEAKDSESLNEDNVNFTVDGEKTDKIPFNPDGLEFKLFYSF